jgi:hypothetical protein
MPVSALTLNAPAGEWIAQAACGGHWDLMAAPDEQTEQDAKNLCRGCPVRTQCLAWVLSLPPARDVDGICGGLTAEERRRTRRNTRRRVQPSDDTPDDHKPCSRCKEIKPLTEYYRDNRAADGRQSRCRTCHQETVLCGPRPHKAVEVRA